MRNRADSSSEKRTRRFAPVPNIHPRSISSSLRPGVERLIAGDPSGRLRVVGYSLLGLAARIHHLIAKAGRGLDGAGEEPARVCRAQIHVTCPIGGGDLSSAAPESGAPAQPHRDHASLVRLGECPTCPFEETLRRRIPASRRGLKRPRRSAPAPHPLPPHHLTRARQHHPLHAVLPGRLQHLEKCRRCCWAAASSGNRHRPAWPPDAPPLRHPSLPGAPIRRRRCSQPPDRKHPASPRRRSRGRPGLGEKLENDSLADSAGGAGDQDDRRVRHEKSSVAIRRLFRRSVYRSYPQESPIMRLGLIADIHEAVEPLIERWNFFAPRESMRSSISATSAECTGDSTTPLPSCTRPGCQASGAITTTACVRRLPTRFAGGSRPG